MLEAVKCHCGSQEWIVAEEVLLDVELSNSNDGQGHAWYRTAKRRKEIEDYLLGEFGKREPFSVPAAVEVTRILGKRQRLWDSSSVLRGSYKQLEDALVACGWFVDDSPKHIKLTIGLQDASQRDKGPATLIRIFAKNNQCKC